MKTQQLDWNAAEALARTMSTDGLQGAIRDIRATLPGADRMDRETGQDRGGRYRDEASVYHRELLRRGLTPG